jgi:hypothetical protein
MRHEIEVYNRNEVLLNDNNGYLYYITLLNIFSNRNPAVVDEFYRICRSMLKIVISIKQNKNKKTKTNNSVTCTQ